MYFCSGLQPDTVPGDIIIVLQLKEHPKFKRKSDDLYVEHSLSLTEALCGFQFALTHLDGRQLLIKSDPGEVIKPGNILRKLVIFVSSECVPFTTIHYILFCSFSLFPMPGQYKAINDEGMPHHLRPFIKGRLYIHFNVDFPDSGFLSPEKCRTLETILPARTSNHLTDMEVDDCEETTMHDVNMEEEMRRKQQQQYQEAYDEDDEPSMPRVQCAQQ